MGAVLVGIRMFLHPARKRLTERRKEEFPFGIKRRCGGDKADRRINLPGVFSHRLDPRSKRVLLQQALQERGVSSRHVLTTASRRTLWKQRVVASSQILLRLDQGDGKPLDSETEQTLICSGRIVT